jgi:hypothetical protein
MEKTAALEMARQTLAIVLQHQDMLNKDTGVRLNSGADVANFCADFVQQYAERLIKMDQAG